jgi:hypothetical protein
MMILSFTEDVDTTSHHHLDRELAIPTTTAVYGLRGVIYPSYEEELG